jgi:hypothetical protein
MASPTDTEVRAFVRRSLVVQVATRSVKGRPFMTPLWFVVDGDALYITTGAQSRAGKNVLRNPEVALLFSGERVHDSTRALTMHGTATVHAGLPPWRILLRVARKYYLVPAALLTELRHARQWRLRQRYYAQTSGGAGYIRVVPTAAQFVASLG